ncbi:CoA transferase [Streptomyces sp. NPDC008317]|uniref:CoA transferase n=1 Tax=Streptomyces sp. NPDC008317 TaxID=3364827 RepID=UPI0036EBF05A
MTATTAGPRTTAAPRIGTAPVSARGGAPATAVRLAVAHLRALGCGTEHGRSGAFTAHYGRVRARCEVSWAGPVDLPLTSEADVQAACGLTQVHGRRYGAPTPLGVDYASCVAGALAATGTLAALAAGPADDGGEIRVTTSVAQAALLSVGQYLAAATAADDWPERHAPGGPPFAAADGVRFELETLDPEAWRGFWSALGVDRADAARGWLPFQQRYATAVCPLPPALHEAVARLPFPELGRLADAIGVDLTPVAAGPPPWADGDERPWRLRPTGPPAAPQAAPGTGAPLDGVTVVEVCRRVQGPLAGHLLRLLGARVVRVEPPGGDPMRGMPPMAGGTSARFTALNDGKETVEADLTTASGRAAVRELLAGAEVFLHSLAPGKDRRSGLDADTLTAHRPGLVHAAASGWGDARGSRPPVGTDFPVQAWTGLAALVTPPGLPPTPSLLTLTDVLGGVICAEGAVAGLLAARRTGRGQAVTSSLLSAARLLCGPRFRSAPARTTVPDRADLTDLAADPRLAPALDRDLCTRAANPWEFHR